MSSENPVQIDLRSDTVTRPSPAMRQAMAEAEVGDDVWGDDPSVAALEARAAELLEHEAGLFLPSGTQSNLAALLSHCQRGDEYIVAADAHTYRYEAGGAAVLGSIQPQPIAVDEFGTLSPAAIRAVIKPDDPHFARTRLVCLENTYHGRVIPLSNMQAVRELCDGTGLALHLDGARVANAAVALGVELSEIGRLFDSVSICLSKGLGAPVGSVLVGAASFIDTARRWRKMLGGGMRQAGVLAAPGLIALERWRALQSDHDNAAALASMLDGIDRLSVRHAWQQSNMVWLDYEEGAAEGFAEQAQSAGVLLSPGSRDMRLVLHRDVARDDLSRIVDVFARGFGV